MFELLEEFIPKLRTVLSRFDFTSVPVDAAVPLYDRLVELERLVSAAKNLAADQVAESRAWWQAGHRSPSHFMAAQESKPLGEAAQMLHAVEGLHELPQVEAAYRQGALNEEQVQDVVSAALADRDKQQYLLQVAEGEALIEFKRECARVRAAALSEEQRQNNGHSRRFLHTWVDFDGAFRLSGRFTTAAGAEILAALEPFRQKVADRASRRGRRGRIGHGAAMADALTELCRASTAGETDPLRPHPRSSIHVRVDLTALQRGHLVPGEVREVPEAGPVTIEAVRKWMAQPDTKVQAILFDGEGIRDVEAMGRSHIPHKLLVALTERDRCCVVPGCAEIYDLEIDHVVPVHRGGPTTLYNLCRLCAWHHYLKTHHGYVLRKRLGHWLWEDPGVIPPTLEQLQPELTLPSGSAPAWALSR